MKNILRIAAFVLAAGMIINRAAAVGPGLDRPTPPPCCADGVCFVHSHHHGYFPTRWRVWPGHGLMPAPTAPTLAAPAPTVSPAPDVPPYDVPPPEKEDLKAPPPTTSPAEGPPSPTPAVPAPTTAPLETLGPREGDGNRTAPFLPTPFSPTPPLPGPDIRPPAFPTTPPGGGGEPQGRLDPPPAPPFAMLRSDRRPRPHTPRAIAPVIEEPRAAMSTPRMRSAGASSSDPPPAPPLPGHAATF
jgi:hypothetical protein